MLRLLDRGLTRHCQGYSRREFLHIGSLALGGLTLPGLLQARAAGSVVKKKSVVLLFLQGGPPHIEFFDPKMTAPDTIRSTTGEIDTKLPGITFGATFPKLAAMADKISVVRSYASGNGGHTYQQVASGNNPSKATMGALYSRIAGPVHGQTCLPSNILILPEAVEPSLKLGNNFETGALPTLTTPGELGPNYAAFNPASGGTLQENLQLRLPRERFDDRKALLNQLDSLKRQLDKTGVFESLDTFQQQAYDVILKGVADAFDLSKEDPQTVERYDTRPLVKLEELTKWFDMRRATNLLGLQMLLARRLVERGVGFVTVSDAGWDMHANNNSPKNMELLPAKSGQVDHVVATFLDDLRERGLSDDVLLVVTGEMGRTPKLNKNGGRDHWGDLTTLLVAGGGLRMGQVIGQSDATASRPATFRYTPAHLLATVMNVLFDVGAVRLLPDLPRAVVQAATDGQTITELF